MMSWVWLSNIFICSFGLNSIPIQVYTFGISLESKLCSKCKGVYQLLLVGQDHPKHVDKPLPFTLTKVPGLGDLGMF